MIMIHAGKKPVFDIASNGSVHNTGLWDFCKNIEKHNRRALKELLRLCFFLTTAYWIFPDIVKNIFLNKTFHKNKKIRIPRLFKKQKNHKTGGKEQKAMADIVNTEKLTEGCGGRTMTAKNENDVRILKKIVESQNAEGALLPKDPDSWKYRWNKEGRLTGINWACSGLTGTLDLEGLDALEWLECSSNELEGLELGGCSALREVRCNFNCLETLDVSACLALEWLECAHNQIKSLDVRENRKLKVVFCHCCQCKSIDLGSHPELEILCCAKNQLTRLHVGLCPSLELLNCSGNKLRELDIRLNPHLVDLHCKNNQLELLDLSGCPHLLNLQYDETASLQNRMEEEMER